MTQTSLDAAGQFSTPDGAHGAGAAASAARTGESKFGTFAITFGIAFAILYTVLERLNWPLFTYLPRPNRVEFWKFSPAAGEGPPMYWYGWCVLAAICATATAWIATMVSGERLRQATLFCCALTALWPTALEALRAFISWVSFDISFLDSVWVAAFPALAGTVALSYYAPPRWVQYLWTRWLLIMPIGGLVVLGYSLKQYFVR